MLMGTLAFGTGDSREASLLLSLCFGVDCLPLIQERTFLKNYLFHVYEYTVAVLRHTRRGHHIPLQMVMSTMRLLGIELRTSGRAASALNR